MKIKSKITHLNVDEIASKTGNIYKSVRVIGKRARQLSAAQKEELNEKLAEFASDVDNLEEVFENREQIEISRYFERLPKSTTVASEELVKSGALNPGILFSTYKVKKPSTSGGVWARVKKVQDLENLLEYNLKNTETLSTHLDLMVKEFLKNKLLPSFAEFYSEKLKLREFEYSSLYDTIIAINILSGNYKDLKTRNKITNLNLQNLLNVINYRDKLVAKYNLLPSFSIT